MSIILLAEERGCFTLFHPTCDSLYIHPDGRKWKQVSSARCCRNNRGWGTRWGHSKATPTESTGQWHSLTWDVTALRWWQGCEHTASAPDRLRTLLNKQMAFVSAFPASISMTLCDPVMPFFRHCGFLVPDPLLFGCWMRSRCWWLFPGNLDRLIVPCNWGKLKCNV